MIFSCFSTVKTLHTAPLRKKRVMKKRPKLTSYIALPFYSEQCFFWFWGCLRWSLHGAQRNLQTQSVSIKLFSGYGPHIHKLRATQSFICLKNDVTSGWHMTQWIYIPQKFIQFKDWVLFFFGNPLQVGKIHSALKIHMGSIKEQLSWTYQTLKELLFVLP